ncbi:MAG: hypothetical protein ACI4TI_00175 [Christensenellales bacterium]
MDCKKIPPENIIKLSASISLILVEKFDQDELSVIKNILYAVANNISAYSSQCFVYDKFKRK